MNSESTPAPSDENSALREAVEQASDALGQNGILLAGYQKLQALLERTGYISKTEIHAIILETLEKITS